MEEEIDGDGRGSRRWREIERTSSLSPSLRKRGKVKPPEGVPARALESTSSTFALYSVRMNELTCTTPGREGKSVAAW